MIKSVTAIKFSYWKAFLLVPILSLITGFLFLLFLKWYIKLRKIFLYEECTKKEATHVFVEDGNNYRELSKLFFYQDLFDS